MADHNPTLIPANVKPALTAEIVRELLDYDPETGALTWRERDAKWFASQARCDAWNAMWAGKSAFSTSQSDGYKTGRFFGSRYYAHRIAWLYHYGEWPSGEVDHINHDRSDNRIFNVRNVSKTENNRNKRMSAANSTGTTGVSWNKQKNKWDACIWNEGARIRIGYFISFDDALAARKVAEIEYGYHENHGKI